MRTAVNAMSGSSSTAEAATDQLVVHRHLVERHARESPPPFDCTRAATCVPSHISHESGFSHTVQLSGSIVAWARNGNS
jgi:hypothetical protein